MDKNDTFACLIITQFALGGTPWTERHYYRDFADACDALSERTHTFLESGFADKGVQDRTRILRNKNWTEIQLSVCHCRFEL